MIIYYNNKNGFIYGAIMGRVHNEFELQSNLLQPRGVKKEDISRSILTLGETLQVEEYLEGSQNKVLDCKVILDDKEELRLVRRTKKKESRAV